MRPGTAIGAEEAGAAADRRLCNFLRSEVRELEALGFGHIAFALAARRCIERLEDREMAGRPAAPTKGVLRLVTTGVPA